MNEKRYNIYLFNGWTLVDSWSSNSAATTKSLLERALADYPIRDMRSGTPEKYLVVTACVDVRVTTQTQRVVTLD